MRRYVERAVEAREAWARSPPSRGAYRAVSLSGPSKKLVIVSTVRSWLVFEVGDHAPTRSPESFPLAGHRGPGVGTWPVPAAPASQRCRREIAGGAFGVPRACPTPPPPAPTHGPAAPTPSRPPRAVHAVPSPAAGGRRRRPHGPSGPGGSPTAGPDGGSMFVPAQMSLVVGGLSIQPIGTAPQSVPAGTFQQAALHLGLSLSCAFLASESPRHPYRAPATTVSSRDRHRNPARPSAADRARTSQRPQPSRCMPS